ncbi:hypothetical protein OS12_20070 [Dickeya oryzae]
MRVSVLAITDHDTTAALAQAQAAIVQQALPLRLIAGVEISTVWENHEIHIVGLGMDCDHPALTSLLQQQVQYRQQRAEQIALRLEKALIPDALAGASRLAEGGMITRGHFARYLVELGKADTVAQVFKKISG